MVVFPEPDGAENTNNFPLVIVLYLCSVTLNLFQGLNFQILKQVQNDRKLQYIQYLLFNLFQFVFHHYYQFLHFGMVGFRAHGINFSSHFLGDET
jgi:hypothetical protein